MDTVQPSSWELWKNSFVLKNYFDWTGLWLCKYVCFAHFIESLLSSSGAVLGKLLQQLKIINQKTLKTKSWEWRPQGKTIQTAKQSVVSKVECFFTARAINAN